MSSVKRELILNEILIKFSKGVSGRLIGAPRIGKSRIAIEIIKQNNYKNILWVTPSRKLAEDDIPKEFIKWGAKPYLSNLQTTTWTSLHKHKGDYDIIILDEEQKATYNNCQNLIDKSLTGNILSMTGTATKDHNKIEIYSSLGLKVLYRFNINKAVKEEILSDYEINIIEISMSLKKDIKAGNKQKQFLTSEAAQYRYLDRIAKQSIYQNRKDIQFRILSRMRAIYNSPSKTVFTKKLLENLKDQKNMIFCGSIKQAEELCKYTYHSKTGSKDLIKFQQDKIKTIALVNSGGLGFTYKNIDNLIIVQADSNVNGNGVQKISRSLLKQNNYKARIWILCLLGTQDEKWVSKMLEDFDIKKVNYYKDYNLIKLWK